MRATSRRHFASRAMLFGIAMAMGKLDSLSAQNGQLTCDLSQWQEVVFKYKGEVIRWPAKDIFEALR